MATIKAGTYRFNDVLTIPIEPVGEEINFTANIGEDGSILAECLGFVMAVSDFDSAGIPMGISLYYYVNSLEPNPGFDVPDEYTVYFANSTRNKRWYTDNYGEGIKTITILTDQEVSTEFAEWFSANAAPVVEHTVSGVWKFKDVLVGDDSESGFQVNVDVSINFTTEYADFVVDCTGIKFTAGADSAGVGYVSRVDYFLTDTFAAMFGSNFATVYNSSGWNNGFGEGIKTIDFGTEPQTVSAEFYNWFTANADEYEPHYISGKWVFNSNITIGDVSFGYDRFTQIAFTSNGQNFLGMVRRVLSESDELNYATSASESLTVWETGVEWGDYLQGWLSDEYRTVDFGNMPLEVDHDFYSWFTSNATKLLPDREISGTWKFNEILYLPDHDIVQNVTFKTQGFIEAFEGYEDAKIWDCSRMRITAGYVQYYVDSTVPDFGGRPRYEYVYTSTVAWTEDSLRVVDFGTTPQTVSGEFYNWVIANAEQTIAGYPFPIELYKNRAEPNRVDKTNYITKIGTMLGTMREESSITDLSITFESVSVPSFNYIYVPIFNRYYFVADIKSLGFKMWQMSLEVDVLMTYKDAILNCIGFVERNEFTYNDKLIDKKRVIEQGYNIYVDEVENDVFRNPASSESTVDIMYVVNGYKIDSADSV